MGNRKITIVISVLFAAVLITLALAPSNTVLASYFQVNITLNSDMKGKNLYLNWSATNATSVIDSPRVTGDAGVPTGPGLNSSIQIIYLNQTVYNGVTG